MIDTLLLFYDTFKSAGIDFNVSVKEDNYYIVVYEMNGHKITLKYKWDRDNVHYKVTSDKNNYLEFHMERLLNGERDETDLVTKTYNILSNPYKYCTVCGNVTKYTYTYISTCKKPECKYEEECILTNNTVTDLYKKDIVSTVMLLRTSFSATKHAKKEHIFNPYPYYFRNSDKVYVRDTMNKTVDIGFQDFNKIGVSIKIEWHSNIDILKNIIDNCETDLDLYKEIGEDSYGIIKFILKSNTSNISAVDFFDTIATKKELIFKEIVGVKMFEIHYHPSIEEGFTSEKSSYLFHGSGLGNWHPIIRNGIRNMSGTHLMAHGQARGPGIYLASNIATSFGYTGGSTMTGVCMVNNKDRYDKGGGIYVVPNDEDVLLKYLILIEKPSQNANNYNKITNYFKTTHKQEETLIDRKLPSIANKRQRKDMELCLSHGLKFIESDDERWIFELENKLQISVFFSSDYPLSPPIISLHKPYTQELSGILTEEGILLVDSIFPKKWRPRTKLYKIILEIGGKINIKNKDDTKFFSYKNVVSTYHKLTKEMNI
mgnify:CR=1 FL=1